MSAAAQAHAASLVYGSPKGGDSVSDGTEDKDEENWSGGEDSGDGEAWQAASGANKRPRPNGQFPRPMSVSCELCKQRKARHPRLSCCYAWALFY